MPEGSVDSQHIDGHCGRLAYCGRVLKFCDCFHGSRMNNCQSFIRRGSGACVTECMSVLTDPATYGILNSELMICPRAAAVLGALAAQWQQVMGTLQRVEQETMSSQSLVHAIENSNKTRRATPPEELVGQHATRRTCTRCRRMAGARRSEA